MRFALTAEQLDFAASLRKMCEAAKTPATVRAWGDGNASAGKALIRQLAEAGALGLTTSEDNGGFGAGPVELMVACTEIGRAAVPGPLVETAAAIPALLQALPDSAKAAEWLPGFAEGAALGTIALPAPGTTGEPIALDADIADVVLVASGDRVSLATPHERIRSVDAARRLFPVAESAVVAEGDGVRAAIESGFDAGALAAAAQLLGAGRALLDTSVDYVKQRQQFGKPIGQYQAIKHLLANVLIGLDMAQPLLYRAALSLQDGSPTASRDISAAKLACGEAAYQAARTALQVHGAIGYTAEFDLSLWITKVTALRSAWGTAEFHRARIAAALRAEGVNA
ncbi:acyl-CoA/acyl-ACP dehydrogenase [Nocardia uniformis]|uniref:Acyl-CoA/acyl-ACP dehydrogenase n=1 Tax=Nocardia uniformis TaxID=53432 RepID=A0A849CB05_9NOCA|nr:acyl-CoA dehydrogenase family protein [Nocardia uniformis]NNH73510.1 acyl-CoA/acyl-ACP dehydrogenase [Nocardia uniformis]